MKPTGDLKLSPQESSGSSTAVGIIQRTSSLALNNTPDNYPTSLAALAYPSSIATLLPEIELLSRNVLYVYDANSKVIHSWFAPLRIHHTSGKSPTCTRRLR